MSRRPTTLALSALSLVALLAAACAPATPAPAPTTAPKAAATAPAAKPTEPAAKPTVAAPKPAASPSAKAAASPAAKPAASPAAKAAASPAAKTAAKPAAKPSFNEQAVTQFYQGKTIKVVVGAPPGGGFDTFSRLISRHIGKYIPGNPNLIVENKPGAASALASNLVYNVEPKDGTVVNHFNFPFILTQAAGITEGIEFDVTKWQWIGAASGSASGCGVRTATGVSTIQDAMEKEVIMATIGPGTSSHIQPAAFNEALGTKFRLVTGYSGSSRLFLAVQQGEADGYCQGLDAMQVTAAPMLDANPPEFKVLIATSKEIPDSPHYRGVPAAEDLAKTEEAKGLLRAIRVGLDITQPWVFAPEVPMDRVNALRHAYNQVVADPALLEEAKQLNLTVALTTGEQLEKEVADVFRLPQSTLDQLRRVVQ